MFRAVCRRWRHTLDTHRFLQQASVRISCAELGEAWASDVIRLVGTILIFGVQQDTGGHEHDDYSVVCDDFQARKLHLQGSWHNMACLKPLIENVEELEIEFYQTNSFGTFNTVILDIIANRSIPLRVLRIENMKTRFCIMEITADPEIFSRAICNVEEVSIDCILTRELQKTIFEEIAINHKVSLRALSIFWIEEDTDVEVFASAVLKLKYVDLKLISTFLFNKIFCSENLTSGLPTLNVEDILPELI